MAYCSAVAMQGLAGLNQEANPFMATPGQLVLEFQQLNPCSVLNQLLTH